MVHSIDALGIVRFFLAISVIIGHLTRDPVFDCHRHAVVGFFCISGYLITRIRLSSYAGRPGAFLVNRFLRIYPQYLVAVAFGGTMVLLLPEAAKTLNQALLWPSTAKDWLVQVSIFGLYGSEVRLSPPTWSLNVELYFYAIIGLLTFRSEKVTYGALLLTLVVGAAALFRMLPPTVLYIFPGEFYGSPVGNAFVFFTGSAACFLSRRRTLPGWLSHAALLAYVANSFVLPALVRDPIHRDMLLVLSAGLIGVVLMNPPSVRIASIRWVPVVNFLGRMSYPLFLVHWSASVWLFSLIGFANPALFIGGLASSLAVSVILVAAVDRPIELLRRRIRQGGKVAPPPCPAPAVVAG